MEATDEVMAQKLQAKNDLYALLRSAVGIYSVHIVFGVKSSCYKYTSEPRKARHSVTYSLYHTHSARDVVGGSRTQMCTLLQQLS